MDASWRVLARFPPNCRMHLLIYRLRADVRAVVHAHPPTATGFAAAGLVLDEPLIAEVELSLGRVPRACYGLPGTAHTCAMGSRL